MTKALGIGLAGLLFVALLHTLPVQWILTALILSGCVTLALLDPPQSDPRRWLPPEEPEDEQPWLLPWTLDDERAFTADCDYDEERSE